MNNSEMTSAGSLLEEMQAGWTRQEFNYENIGGPSGTNYSTDDDALTIARARGVKVVGLLNYSGSTPSATNWENYVANVVNHFAAKVDAWEVLNEPNDAANSSHQLNPPTYNDYLFRSNGQIRTYDPTATIVSAGVAGVDLNWLEEFVNVGGCNYFDALGIHPYRSDKPELVKFGEGDFANYIGTAAGLLRKKCTNKKIWLTEFGLRSDTAGSEPQANYLAREFLLAQTLPEIQGVLSYLFRDDSTGDWGVVNSGFAKKSSFGRVQQVFEQTSGKSFLGFETLADQRGFEGFESTAGWGQQFNNNASATIGAVAGREGNALQIKYQFNASNSAVILTKDAALAGTPSGIGLLVNGDNSRAIWRLRFTDAQGETFQALLGTGLSGWNYKQFDFSHTGAMTFWGGDGVIQYPVRFNSVVIDRDGGDASGTVQVDKLVAVYGPADYVGLKFDGVVAAWKSLGSGTTTVCGSSVTLTEQPTYITSGSCFPAPNIADQYHAGWVSQNSNPTLLQGQSAQLEVQLRNTGSATWNKGSIFLGTDREQNRTPAFTRGSGWVSTNRVGMVESSVDPGSTATFRLTNTVPGGLATGTYREYFRPVAEGITWMDDMGIYWDVTVQSLADTYHAAWVSQSSYPAALPGQTVQMQVVLRNTGSSTWQKNTVLLGTDRSQDRIPAFIRQAGFVTSNRVEFFESSVAPNQTGTFSFSYTIPNDRAPGVYHEYFRPVAEGITWMDDMGIFWDVTVQSLADTYHAAWVSQTSYQAALPGQTVQMQVVLRNTGSSTWQKSSVFLGTDRSPDRIPAFIRRAGFVAPNRVEFLEASVAPNQTGTFNFSYTIPSDRAPGVYREYFRPVVEGITWLEDMGIYWDVTVQ
ncbi:MAG: glycosyl hydrolase [Patescibacteria group bacterium]